MDAMIGHLLLRNLTNDSLWYSIQPVQSAGAEKLRMSCALTDFVCLNQNYAGILQAAIYLVQTIILIAGLVIAIKQLTVLGRNIRGSNSLEFVRGHRDIMRIAFDRTFLFRTLTFSAATTGEKRSEPAFDDLCRMAELDPQQCEEARMFHSMLINHMAAAHVQFRLGNIPVQSWRGYEPDIRDYFLHDFPRARWAEVRKYQPPTFAEYIDNVLVKSAREGHG